MTIQPYLFDAGGSDRAVALDRQTVEALTDQHLLWIDVTGQDEAELRHLGALLGLHPQSIHNLIHPLQRPRLEVYQGYFQGNVVAVKVIDDRYTPIELDLVVGANYIVTAHSEPIEFLEQFAHQLWADTQLGRLTAVAFLATLLDWQLDSYYRVLETLEVTIDRLDDTALRVPADRRFLDQLVAVRERVAILRRLLTPHREVFAALTRPDFEPVASTEVGPQLRALGARFERLLEAIERAREMVIGSFDLFMGRTAQFTNDTMRVLTLVTALVGLGALVTGVFGMNFEVELFQSGMVGFSLAIAGILVMVTGILLLVRWRRWL